MKLLTLNLNNFQGIKNLTLDTQGANADIYGDNATGKTTIFNAITWLLFGKPSTGAKNFSPKTQGLKGDLHNLEHSAEAAFRLDDGRIITLKKCLKESYKKKRGSSAEEFTGHVVDHYIDGVPVKEKEYLAAINDFCGDEANIKVLMIPGYFAEELPWESRRRVLLEICGDVGDAEVIASNEELEGLKAFLLMPGTVDQYYTIDEYKKIAAGKWAEINKTLQAIPARIDEATKAAPTLPGVDEETIQATINQLGAKIEAKKAEKLRLVSEDGATTAINTKIAELKQKLAEAKAAHIEKEAEANKATYALIGSISALKMNLREDLNKKSLELSTNLNNLKSMNHERSNLRQMYITWQEKQWEGDEICPTCNQPLPEAEVEQAKAQFNLNKSKKLEEINQAGQKSCSISMINDLETKIKDLEKEIEASRQELTGIEQEEANTQKGLVLATAFDTTQEYGDIQTQITELETDKTKAGLVLGEQIGVIADEIKDLEILVNDAQNQKAKFALVKQQNDRIKALEAQEKQLAQEFEELQRGVYLCEEFIKAKVAMLTDRINSKFKSVRFRLFVEQINGGIKEDCEVLVPSEGRLVPYAFANNAGRINAGLEIINALSRHWGMSVPVCVDNAESVTRLIDTDTQLIRLIVSEPDKALRLELDSPSKVKKVS